MIQRKQTLFMLLAVALIILCLCLPIGSIEPQGMGVPAVWYNMGIYGDQGLTAKPIPFVDLAVAGVLTMANIFLYRRRKLQARMCVVAIVMLIGWYGYLLGTWMGLREGSQTLHWAIGACLPLISIVLLWLARLGVVADEKLVRSMDRIR